MTMPYPYFVPMAAYDAVTGKQLIGGGVEHSTYNRTPVAFAWTTRKANWWWNHGNDENAMPAGLRYRVVVWRNEGEAAYATGPWVTRSNGMYVFSLDLPDGHFLVWPEIDPTSIPAGATWKGPKIMAQPLLINASGVKLVDQRPWVATTRFECSEGKPYPKPFQVTLPVKPPFAAKKKARVVERFSTILPRNQMWVSRWSFNEHHAMYRSAFQTSDGDLVIMPWQKYEYGNAVSLGSYRAGLTPPKPPVCDGPLNQGKLGFVTKIIPRKGGTKGFYFWESDGRHGHVQYEAFSAPATVDLSVTTLVPGEGEVNTFAGWRVKPGEAPELNQGARGWGHVGDWSRVANGIENFHEIWGGAVAFRNTDGTVSDDNGLDFWHFDTLNQRVLYEDGWAKHADVSTVTGRPTKPHFPPAWYPGTDVRGQSVLVDFAGSRDAPPTPTPEVNEPWDGGMRLQDEYIYWTNHAGQSIARQHWSGSGLEVVIKSAVTLTNADLQLPNAYPETGGRLQPSAIPLQKLRDLYLKDGVQGEAIMVRPQGMAYDANGDILFWDHFLFALRKYTFATKRIDTLGVVPDLDANGNPGGAFYGFMPATYTRPDGTVVKSITLTASSSSTHDAMISHDRHGYCGPKGDTLVSAWGGPSVWRFGADGTFRGFFYDVASKWLASGPADMTFNPNYCWANAFGEGEIIGVGNAGAQEFSRMSKRQPTDPPNPDIARFQRGYLVWLDTVALRCGQHGYNEHGQPNIEEMGAWSDGQIADFFLEYTITATQLGDVTYFIRISTWECDYGVAPAPDTTAPLPASAQGFVTQTWGSNMWNCIYRNTASASTDVKKAVLYVDGAEKQTADVTPSALFTFTFALPPLVNAQVGVSFRDAVPNESAQVVQTVSTPAAPDLQAPDPALGPGTIASMTWIP